MTSAALVRDGCSEVSERFVDFLNFRSSNGICSVLEFSFKSLIRSPQYYQLPPHRILMFLLSLYFLDSGVYLIQFRPRYFRQISFGLQIVDSKSRVIPEGCFYGWSVSGSEGELSEAGVKLVVAWSEIWREVWRGMESNIGIIIVSIAIGSVTGCDGGAVSRGGGCDTTTP